MDCNLSFNPIHGEEFPQLMLNDKKFLATDETLRVRR
jgi:hypothetical protein